MMLKGTTMMLKRSLTVVLLLGVLGVGFSAGQQAPSGGTGRSRVQAPPAPAQGKSFRLEQVYLIGIETPPGDADRILQAVTQVVPLAYGHYDRVAYISAAGTEQFRDREGSRSGPREQVERDQFVELSFSIPKDDDVLRTTLETVRYVHPYEEPVIYVQEVWASRAIRTPDEDANPNRWWNRNLISGH